MTPVTGRSLRLPLHILLRTETSSLSAATPVAYAVLSSGALRPCVPAAQRGHGLRRTVVTTSGFKSNNNNNSSSGAADEAAMALRQRRSIHSSDRRTTSTLAQHPIPEPSPQGTEPASRAPLSMLPLSMILRSFATTVVSSSPVLLPPSLTIMGLLAHSTNPLLNPDRNPLLRWLLKRSFYAQFCAGEDPAEVRATVARLKGIGFTGVILGFAREVVLTERQAADMADGRMGEETQQCIQDEIIPWTEGTLETVRLTEPGDYVALK